MRRRIGLAARRPRQRRRPQTQASPRQETRRSSHLPGPTPLRSPTTQASWSHCGRPGAWAPPGAEEESGRLEAILARPVTRERAVSPPIGYPTAIAVSVRGASSAAIASAIRLPNEYRSGTPSQTGGPVRPRLLAGRLAGLHRVLHVGPQHGQHDRGAEQHHDDRALCRSSSASRTSQAVHSAQRRRPGVRGREAPRGRRRPGPDRP
jgi:hypothetical protein